MIITYKQHKLELENLHKAELEEIRSEMIAEITLIKQQISLAYIDGSYKNNPEWHKRATWAKHYKNKLIRKIEAELGRRKQDRELNEIFMDVAREYMTARDYDRIYFLAKQRKNEKAESDEQRGGRNGNRQEGAEKS